MNRKLSWVIIGLLTVAHGVVLFSATPVHDSDDTYYQKFTESLASGNLDLSIPGFHGSGFFAAIWHLIHPSAFSHIQTQMAFALFIPLLAFLAGRSVFQEERAGLLLAAGFSMMPFWWAVSLTGYTGGVYTCMLLLTLYGASEGKKWTWLPWGMAMIIKPFAVALLPVIGYFLWQRLPKKKVPFWPMFGPILLGFLVPVAYAFVQHLQAGHLIVGAHPDFNQHNIWQNPMKIFLNVAYTLQILFSVHNYHYPNPGGTGHDNLLHTSPILMVLGLWALVENKTYFKDARFAAAIMLGIAIAFGLNAVVGTMDHYYMQPGVLLLVLAALPVLQRQPLWIPLVLATLHFQWFYFHLRYSEILNLGFFSYVLPVLVDGVFLLTLLLPNPRKKGLLSRIRGR